MHEISVKYLPAHLEHRFAAIFGEEVQFERPLATSGMGARVVGIDLSNPLRSAQVELLLDTLSHSRLLTIAGQDLERFSLETFERFANHWGAPVAHPSNFLRGGKPAQQDGASDGAIEYQPYAHRRVAAADTVEPARSASAIRRSGSRPGSSGSAGSPPVVALVPCDPPPAPADDPTGPVVP